MNAPAPMTLARYLGFDPVEAAQETWRNDLTESWPTRWRNGALRQHAYLRTTRSLDEANTWLLDIGQRIQHCRIHPSARDSEIIAQAEQFAKRATDRARHWQRHGPAKMRRQLEALCIDQGIEPPPGSKSDLAAVARMTSSSWARRKFRRLQGREREDIAIALGYVHKRKDLYISQESFEAEIQKERRNEAILEDMEAISEDGEILALSSLVEHSISNPAIRRNELMVRLKGMETIAHEVGHVGLFVTLTCPSRMHARLAASGSANPSYDNTTPRQAQRYLCRLWECIRSKLRHEHIGLYGLRIAEPHHDGTPHWHLLLFVSPADLSQVKQVFARYALRDTPDETGASAHRVKFENIDPNKGSAVSYVAKYIGKNIDGTGIAMDENGLHGQESAKRVTAWARLHGIRQFQAIGGAPVGLWRELRRIPPANIEGAPDALQTAWHSAQKTEEQQADFSGLIRAIGGPLLKRADHAIQLATDTAERPGRYGYEVASKPAGVFMRDKPKARFLSERKAYQLRMKAVEFGKRFTGDWAASLRPWTRVNNCAVIAAQGIARGNVIPFPSPTGHPIETSEACHG